jgi:DNA-binding IclR family transcriptional regulator
MPTDDTGAQAVDRALTVLELFDEHTVRLTPTFVARALGVHRTTASRLLAALERHRLVEVDRDAGGYVPGLGLVSLAGHVFNRFPVWAVGRSIVRELRNATGETAWLGVLDGDEVVYIDQASSPHVRVHADWVGRRQTLTASVTGAVLLAYQEPEVIEELLRAGRSDGEPAAQHLEAPELATVRARGHLARYEDPTSGHAVVAVPVRDHRGRVVAALSLSGLRDRIDLSRFAEDLVPAARHAASRISEELGHAGTTRG